MIQLAIIRPLDQDSPWTLFVIALTHQWCKHGTDLGQFWEFFRTPDICIIFAAISRNKNAIMQKFFANTYGDRLGFSPTSTKFSHHNSGLSSWKNLALMIIADSSFNRFNWWQWMVLELETWVCLKMAQKSNNHFDRDKLWLTVGFGGVPAQNQEKPTKQQQRQAFQQQDRSFYTNMKLTMFHH